MNAWYWGLSEQEWDKLVADTELYNSKVKAGEILSDRTTDRRNIQVDENIRA